VTSDLADVGKEDAVAAGLAEMSYPRGTKNEYSPNARRVPNKGAGVATTAMVKAYLEQLLLEEYGDDVETTDGGYEIPLAGGLRIGVVDGNHRTRRVLVTARIMIVEDVTIELLETINQLNAVSLYGRFFLLDDEVQVED
jgi:hypothetical protein